MLWPAVKLMDNIVGIDVHPVVGPLVHPYLGPIFMWHSPKFPMADVLINSMPACAVGAMGYSAHVPQGLPVPPTPTNVSYWTRWQTNIAMGVCLMGLTILANLAIAGIAACIPNKPKSVENFIKDVTGIDTTNTMTTWQTISSSFSTFIQWQTWVKLLMPPIPYPGAQGSTAVGSPNVTVNGAPLAFVAPLVATSCSEIPVVPNAMTVGFSNVLVGVTMSELLRGIAVSVAQAAIQEGTKRGLEHAFRPDQEGRRSCGCPSGRA